ncbi:MAG: DUF5132 domain-containing protein [Acidobacteriota bacterium]|jgi:hypothetical protein
MALFDDEQWSLIKGIGIGIGLTLVARELLPPFRDAARPLAKAGLKGSMSVFERSREALARAGETVEDLVAEVKLEREVAALSAAAAARRGGRGGTGDGDSEGNRGPRPVPDPAGDPAEDPGGEG